MISALWLLPLGIAAGGALGLRVMARRLRTEASRLVEVTAEVRRAAE